MLTLSSTERRSLRARAHSLHPVVAISDKGLSESVVREINASLISHELIKVRVHNADRQVREEFLNMLCERLEAAPVQHIGKLLVLWRPQPAEQVRTVRRHAGRAAPRFSKRSFPGPVER